MSPGQMITVREKHLRPLGTLARQRTALEALALAEPLARTYDPDARLVLLVSGSDVDGQGRSSRWELLWDFPARRAQAVVIVGLLELQEYDGPEADGLLATVRPFLSPDNPLVKRLAPAQIAQMWQDELQRRGSLPLPFRNSPVAAQDFMKQGVDFVSGDTSMVMLGRTAADGVAIWEAEAYGVTYRTPLARSGA